MPGAQRATAEFEHCIKLYIISMTLNKLGFRWIQKFAARSQEVLFSVAMNLW